MTSFVHVDWIIASARSIWDSEVALSFPVYSKSLFLSLTRWYLAVYDAGSKLVVGFLFQRVCVLVAFSFRNICMINNSVSTSKIQSRSLNCRYLCALYILLFFFSLLYTIYLYRFIGSLDKFVITFIKNSKSVSSKTNINFILFVLFDFSHVEQFFTHKADISQRYFKKVHNFVNRYSSDCIQPKSTFEKYIKTEAANTLLEKVMFI